MHNTGRGIEYDETESSEESEEIPLKADIDKSAVEGIALEETSLEEIDDIYIEECSDSDDEEMEPEEGDVSSEIEDVPDNFE